MAFRACLTLCSFSRSRLHSPGLPFLGVVQGKWGMLPLSLCWSSNAGSPARGRASGRRATPGLQQVALWSELRRLLLWTRVLKALPSGPMAVEDQIQRTQDAAHSQTSGAHAAPHIPCSRRSAPRCSQIWPGSAAAGRAESGSPPRVQPPGR